MDVSRDRSATDVSVDQPAAATLGSEAADVTGGAAERAAAPAEPRNQPAARSPERARTPTVTMPVQASVGGPPAMPAEAAPIAAAVNIEAPEDPTRMPGPREIPEGSPGDPAAPPGYVPRGDSRSLRRYADPAEFALVYRIQTYVISRYGVVGTRGQWRVVEYPTSGAAGHAYAKECSRFVSEGFSDYRA
jgi:hypothetical protein